MKKYNVIDKKKGNLIITVITYDRKVTRGFLTMLKKIPNIIIEECE